jgi:hypothetical protein
MIILIDLLMSHKKIDILSKKGVQIPEFHIFGR